MSECPLPASFATPPQALKMLTRLQQESAGNACHGLVAISLKPNATLLRLTPENTARLHEEISLRLTQALREQDTLYALGVWEWLAVLPHLPSPASVSFAMLKLHRIFQQSPPRIEGQEASLQPVCGSAICPDHGDDPQHLLQSARIAALYACQQGEWMAIYQPDMERGGRESADLIRQLQSALLEDQL
ncbi:MAG: diguanylate cyclase, partial [Zoogloeaceae bacterium]|nr:diguanylate cyclase [Zoogloeaceae bacterium]